MRYRTFLKLIVETILSDFSCNITKKCICNSKKIFIFFRISFAFISNNYLKKLKEVKK